MLRRSVRIVMGLPINCANQALMAESDLDTVEEIAMKSAISFHTRLNPTDLTQQTLAGKHFLKCKPKWAELLKGVPLSIWEGPTQTTLSKKVLLTTDKVRVSINTLMTQVQADKEESNFSRLLYTDASMIQTSTPPGKAAIGYIWYARDDGGASQVTRKESMSIGEGHSSYSAEALAIRIGLENDPQALNIPDQQKTMVLDTTSEQVRAGKCVRNGGNARVTNLVPGPAPPCQVGIFTDSLSNLETIKKGITETPEQRDLLQALVDYPQFLTFHHVRSHRNNAKNVAVDELCNAAVNPSDRTNANHLAGKKTSSKIKVWTKNWISNRRMEKIMTDTTMARRGSETQRWMKKNLADSTGQKMIPRLRAQNQLPRRKGVLISKARTNRWTQCNWYLHNITSTERDNPNCTKCKSLNGDGIKDTTEHMINDCLIHDEARSRMLYMI